MKSRWFWLGWPLLVVPQILFWFGALLNQIAEAANGGAMPVLANNCNMGDDLSHICMTPATHLKFLCDWIQLKLMVASVGDVFVWTGSLIMAPLFWAWLTLLLCAALGFLRVEEK